jgi:hypothetical protein
MGRYYVLCADGVAEEPDFGQWVAWHASWYEKLRCVARTSVKFGNVVTVFLGVNMALAESDPPLLFETRVMGGWLDDQSERYSTLEEARAGHQAWVARIRAMEQENELPPPSCPVW